MLKYNLQDLFDSLSKKDHDTRKTLLIKELGVGRSTLNDWINLTHKHTRDIPGTKLLIIAKFFNCNIEDLINQAPDTKTIKIPARGHSKTALLKKTSKRKKTTL